MPIFDHIFESYPRYDTLWEQFGAAMVSALITAGLFRLVDYLTHYQMSFAARSFGSWGACYIVMLAIIGCARYRYFSPLASKLDFVKSFMLSVLGFLVWIVVLYLIDFYSIAYRNNYYLIKAIGLAVPLNGALMCGVEYYVQPRCMK